MKFDTHTHTNISPCSGMSPESLVNSAKKAGMDTIVVCDHNEINGALKAKSIASDRELIVELGIELSTEFGEFGVKFLKENECERFMRIKNEKGKFDFFVL